MPEIPVLPTKAERVDPPAEFDVLQHQAKAFDQILCNMADVVDMTDKLADAAKKAGSDKGADAAHRKARSHRVLQPIVNEAVRQSGNEATGRLPQGLSRAGTPPRALAVGGVAAMRNTKTAAATLQQREAVAYPMVIIQSDAAAPRYERGNYTYKPAR